MPQPAPHAEGAEAPAPQSTPTGYVIEALKLLRELAARGDLHRLMP